MADSYLLNLSFQASSPADAEAVRSKVEKVAEELRQAPQPIDCQIDFAVDVLAFPQEKTELRAAANQEITEGPPEDEDD